MTLANYMFILYLCNRRYKAMLILDNQLSQLLANYTKGTVESEMHGHYQMFFSKTHENVTNNPGFV